MQPLWDPKEAESDGVYKEVHVHSPGMISFTHRPLTEDNLDDIKDTETYRQFVGAHSDDPVEPASSTETNVKES